MKHAELPEFIDNLKKNPKDLLYEEQISMKNLANKSESKQATSAAFGATALIVSPQFPSVRNAHYEIPPFAS